jgi:hypothetical protein
MQFLIALSLFFAQSILAQECNLYQACVNIYQEHKRGTCAVLAERNATQALECNCQFDVRTIDCYNNCPNDATANTLRLQAIEIANATCLQAGRDYRNPGASSWITPSQSSALPVTSTMMTSKSEATMPAASPSANVKSDAHKVLFSLSALVGASLFL